MRKLTYFSAAQISVNDGDNSRKLIKYKLGGD